MFVVFVLVTVAVPTCVVIWSLADLSMWQGMLLMVLSVTAIPLIGLGLTLAAQHFMPRRGEKAVAARRAS